MCPLLYTDSSQWIITSLELTILRVQVDYQKLATLAGFKTAASASNSFFLVKKKINAGAGAVAKANVAEEGGEGDSNGAEAGETNQDGGPATPAPKKRVRKAKAPPTSAEDTNGAANGDENGDEPTEPTPNTPKKRARKPKAEPQSGDEATTPKKRARKAVEPKVGEEGKVETPYSGGDEGSILPTPASPSPVKKRVRKPKDDSSKPSSAKRAKKSAEIVTGDASADEAENEAIAATSIANTIADNSMTDAKLGDGDKQTTAAIFGPKVAPNRAGTSTVLTAELAAPAANKYSKGGQSDFLALVAGDDDVPADMIGNTAGGETTYAAGQGVIPA